MSDPDGDKTGQESSSEQKGHQGQGVPGFSGPGGRELARRARQQQTREGAEKAKGVRQQAEGAFGGALVKLVLELGRLWTQREGARKKVEGVLELTDTEEYRVWWLAERIIGATKGVIPISAEVSSRINIPIIPLGMVELLRGIVPGREALAELEALEVVDAEVRALPEEPPPLEPGQVETRKQRKQRNRWVAGQEREADRKARQASKKRRKKGRRPTPAQSDAPAPPGARTPPSQPATAAPAAPTTPTPDVGDP